MTAVRVAPLLAGMALAGLALTGCSLLTIKSPEVPLTAREQEARLLTRDYASHFAATVTQLIDDAAHGSSDAALRSQALRLKLGAVAEITRASTGLSPMASLLDTWAFSMQFRDFLVTGAGSGLLGSAQSDVRVGATLLASEADGLARKVADSDYPRYHAFVLHYTEDHPAREPGFWCGLRYSRPGSRRNTTRIHCMRQARWPRHSAMCPIAYASTANEYPR